MTKTCMTKGKTGKKRVENIWLTLFDPSSMSSMAMRMRWRRAIITQRRMTNRRPRMMQKASQVSARARTS